MRYFFAFQKLLYCYIVTLVTQKLFSETVNCYLLFVICNAKKIVFGNCNTVTVTQKIHLWKLSTVNCNAKKIVFKNCNSVSCKDCNANLKFEV